MQERCTVWSSIQTRSLPLSRRISTLGDATKCEKATGAPEAFRFVDRERGQHTTLQGRGVHVCFANLDVWPLQNAKAWERSQRPRAQTVHGPAVGAPRLPGPATQWQRQARNTVWFLVGNGELDFGDHYWGLNRDYHRDPFPPFPTEPDRILHRHGQEVSRGRELSDWNTWHPVVAGRIESAEAPSRFASTDAYLACGKTRHAMLLPIQ